MVYSEKFRDRMLKRLLSPGGPSARDLAQETGVSAATLCRWRRDSLTSAVSNEEDDGSESSGNSRPKLPLTSLDRARLVMEAEDKKLVEALRKELHKKEKALAEAAALLVLRKKVRALLGDEDDDTDLS